MMLRFAARIIRNVFRPPRTEPFPFGPADTPSAYRGRIDIGAEACVGCSTCAQVCPSLAIRVEDGEEGIAVSVWHGLCTFCGLCAFYCPTQAITITNDWDLAHENSKKFAMSQTILARYQTCGDCGGRLMVPEERVIAAAIIGHRRGQGGLEARCEPCRRKHQATRTLAAAQHLEMSRYSSAQPSRHPSSMLEDSGERE